LGGIKKKGVNVNDKEKDERKLARKKVHAER
jgi:hypothetical protein